MTMYDISGRQIVVGDLLVTRYGGYCLVINDKYAWHPHGKYHLEAANERFYKADMTTEKEQKLKKLLERAYQQELQKKADYKEANRSFLCGDIGEMTLCGKRRALLHLGRYDINVPMVLNGYKEIKPVYNSDWDKYNLYLELVSEKHTDGLLNITYGWMAELSRTYTKDMEDYHHELWKCIEGDEKFQVDFKKLLETGISVWYDTEDGGYTEMFRGHYYTFYFSTGKIRLEKIIRRKAFEVVNTYDIGESFKIPVLYEDNYKDQGFKLCRMEMELRRRRGYGNH